MEDKHAQHQQEASAHDGSSGAQSRIREESRHSAKSRAGVQQGRSGETEAATREVACAYACTVDGFISIAPRAIRNPESPMIVWMSHTSWQQLAVCATTQGQFYIPCPAVGASLEWLRILAEDYNASKC